VSRQGQHEKNCVVGIPNLAICRYATELYLHAFLALLFECLPRSQSLHSKQQYNAFLPVFEHNPTLPDVYLIKGRLYALTAMGMHNLL
jgi:hypothetical protein